MCQPSDVTYGTKFWLCCGAQGSAGGRLGVLCECVRVRARRGEEGASFDSAGAAEVDWVAL